MRRPEVPRPEPAALDAAEIARHLNNAELNFAIEDGVDSSNLRLAARRDQGDDLRVLLAEQQSAGRGRQGRVWHSPARRGLYLSMAWEFDRPASELTALSLVAGLAAAEAVARHSGIQVGLKWPNDLQVKQRKLGGCLIDLSAAGSARSVAIIGIGINVDLGEFSGPDQPWTDLVREGGSSDRNALAAGLINALEQDLERFDRSGFAVFRRRWRRHDSLYGMPLRVSGRATACQGRGGGVDAWGALIVETASGPVSLRVGEVSVRGLTGG